MEKENTLNMEGIEYPVSLKDLKSKIQVYPSQYLDMKKAFIRLEIAILWIKNIK